MRLTQRQREFLEDTERYSIPWFRRRGLSQRGNPQVIAALEFRGLIEPREEEFGTWDITEEGLKALHPD